MQIIGSSWRSLASLLYCREGALGEVAAKHPGSGVGREERGRPWRNTKHCVEAKHLGLSWLAASSHSGIGYTRLDLEELASGSESDDGEAGMLHRGPLIRIPTQCPPFQPLLPHLSARNLHFL
ncbi:hypothetical protein E2C01_083751 [Portunus trituberculatus]|uniref:Uncharacterized protein n=1 Tax=Portunus trituberculatus TaxID=210409 RepID=A0A5B7IW02_PORTR|nr:hypothetical protein [Portunus trituberculatus]